MQGAPVHLCGHRGESGLPMTDFQPGNCSSRLPGERIRFVNFVTIDHHATNQDRYPKVPILNQPHK